MGWLGWGGWHVSASVRARARGCREGEGWGLGQRASLASSCVARSSKCSLVATRASRFASARPSALASASCRRSLRDARSSRSKPSTLRCSRPALCSAASAAAWPARKLASSCRSARTLASASSFCAWRSAACCAACCASASSPPPPANFRGVAGPLSLSPSASDASMKLTARRTSLGVWSRIGTWISSLSSTRRTCAVS